MKPTLFVLVTSFLFQVLAPGLAHASGQLKALKSEREDKRIAAARQAIQGVSTKGTRIRVKTLAGPIVGWLAEVDQGELAILTKHGLNQVPVSSIRKLEVSIERRREKMSGMLIGGLLVIVFHQGLNVPWESQYITYFSLPIFATFTCFGASRISDKWVEIPTRSLNLGIAPTRRSGLQAALTFDF